MDDILLMQAAMEASAMPPPASPASSRNCDLSGEASFNSKLEKAMSDQPDEEALLLATEAVVVPMQSQENQPRMDEEAVKSLEAEAQALAQQVYALVEGQVKQVQPALASIISPDPSAEDGAGAEQTAQAALPETLANGMTKQEAASEIPVWLKAASQQLAADAAKTEKNKADSATTSNAQTLEAATSSLTASDTGQSAEKISAELLGALKAASDTKGQASIKASGDVNHPIQPDNAGTDAAKDMNSKTALGTENAEIKVDFAKVSESARQAVQTVNVQAKAEAGEGSQTAAVDDLAGAPVSESRKVKANLDKMEGESPGQVFTSNRAAQSLDAQVKEPARLAEARTPEMIDQITKNIELLNKSDGQSLRIQLQPENLGKIEIRLTSRADGVTVTLNADTAMTSNLLERSLVELRTSLADAGVNLASLSVNSGQKQATYQESKQWYSGNESRNNHSNQNNKVEDLPAVESTWKDSAIDYRI